MLRLLAHLYNIHNNMYIICITYAYSILNMTLHIALMMIFNQNLDAIIHDFMCDS